MCSSFLSFEKRMTSSRLYLERSRFQIAKRDAYQILNTGPASWPFRGTSVSSDPASSGAVGSRIIRGGGDAGRLDRLGVRSLTEARERVKQVLFICAAIICRSPMTQELFNALAEDRGLPFRAESVGTAALEGRPMAENALAALKEVGIYPEPTAHGE